MAQDKYFKARISIERGDGWVGLERRTFWTLPKRYLTGPDGVLAAIEFRVENEDYDPSDVREIVIFTGNSKEIERI